MAKHGQLSFQATHATVTIANLLEEHIYRLLLAFVQ